MEKHESLQLARRAQSGDAAAYEALLAAHYELIFRTAWKWCGLREDAEDITQAVCLKLPQILPQFRGDSAFSSWLYRVTINAAKDYAKSQHRHHHEGEAALARFESDAPDPEQSVIAKRLYWCISQLSDGLREAVLLVCAEGLTHAEAALALGSKEGTISWRLSEAKKKLSVCIEGASA